VFRASFARKGENGKGESDKVKGCLRLLFSCDARVIFPFTILYKRPYRKDNKHTILIVQLPQKLLFEDTMVEDPDTGNSIFI
jgi:hypothetical protein